MKRLLWNNAQTFLMSRVFFDEDGSGGGSGGDNGSGDEQPKFTQEQVNGIVASERKKNNAAFLRDLGFDNIEDVKSIIAEYNDAKDKQKDDVEKAQERANQLQKEKDEETRKSLSLQNKLTAISQGCDPKNVDDIVILAESKIDDDTDFETALEEVKKQYPSLFESSSNKGTGQGGTSKRSRMSSGDVDGIGKRLAEQRKKDNSAKSNSYFK